MEQAETTQRATDTEVEMVRTMLAIAAGIDRLDDLSEQQPGSSLAATPALVRTGEGLRARAEQAARLSQCPVLLRLVEEDAREK